MARLNDNLQTHCFYEPLHARLFQSIKTDVRKGHLAEPIPLADQFNKDPALEGLGASRYLADLIDRARRRPTPAPTPEWLATSADAAS